MSAKPAPDTIYARRTRMMAFRASILSAYFRNTGITSKAAHRLFTTALDYAGGLQQFDATFQQIGRRMLGAGKSDSACVSAVSRDVRTHKGECEASGYPGLKVISGFRKEDKHGNVEYEVAHWDFKALPYLVAMQEHATRLEKENRRLPYDRRMKREPLFDEAFRLAEVPRAEVALDDPDPTDQTDEEPEPDDDDFNMAYRRTIAYARSARLKLIKRNAPEEIHAATLQLFKEDLDRIFSLSPDQLKQKINPHDFATNYAPPVEEEACTSLANEAQEEPVTQKASASENDSTNSGFVGENEHFSENMGTNLEQAQAALAALSSVGVEKVNVLFCDDVKHDRLQAERARLKAEGVSPEELDRRGINTQEAVETNEKRISIQRLRSLLKAKMAECEKRKWSFIVDPRSVGEHFVQVDDGDLEALDLLAPIALYTIETSDGNGQAAIVLPSDLTTQQYDEIKDRLFIALKPMGCNKGSSGASRWPGSFNFKPKRQRADGSYPSVKLRSYNPGRVVTPEELQSLGLLPERPKPRPVHHSANTRIPTDWPEYDAALASTDRSQADWKFTCAAKALGWTPAHVSAKLLEFSDKAQQRARRSNRYVDRTVEKAFNKSVSSRQPFNTRETGVI
jgi:hypothetical protein